ncbi:hypothetical protein, partial [Escherichia coli]|uniref:hypothetical protein n=1 Tax=Escherichia coli TaxID=562 RepID=UPI003CE4799C
GRPAPTSLLCKDSSRTRSRRPLGSAWPGVGEAPARRRRGAVGGGGAPLRRGQSECRYPTRATEQQPR